MAQDVKQAELIIENSNDIRELAKRIRKIDDFYVLDFTAAQKDSIMPYREYRKLDSKTVRVYLGKDISN